MSQMYLKRPRADDDDTGASLTSPPSPSSSPWPKRQRTESHTIVAHTGADRLSPLSDELLIRILSYLSLPHLLAVAPVSHRFHHLSEDSQLWKALYYARFVLPRAMRIPGFREGKLDSRLRDHKLHYKGRRALWADGRLGGLVRTEVERNEHGLPRMRLDQEEDTARGNVRVNWKRQYKIRYNWARGKCAVEELKLGPDPQDELNSVTDEDDTDKSKILVKVVEGLAITADNVSGLRAWDLKTREVVAQISLRDQEGEDDEGTPPSCLTIDDRNSDKGALEICVGFTNGSFGIWRLDSQHKSLSRLYRHEPSSNGELKGMAYSHPYLLTATGAILVSLYTFDIPEVLEPRDGKEDYTRDVSSASSNATGDSSKATTTGAAHTSTPNGSSLPAPYLMTSLNSHTSDLPLALSIREIASTTVASIAYTFFTRQGWSIGIQDLHITPNDNPKYAPNIITRLAYTTPIITGNNPLTSPTILPRGATQERLPQTPQAILSYNQSPRTAAANPTTQIMTPAALFRGPTTLCYSHPYLLATLPDNTLILHLCTSTASTLSISPGIRLWGHTSGISDAEITARGKAVSVSSRGEEMRVWELEGRPSGVRSRSVEIRPGGGITTPTTVSGRPEESCATGSKDKEGVDWEERRNWVGFDDEMVIVLKETKGGRESLLVYDFT